MISEFGRGRRNSSKCLARGCKGGLAKEMRPCGESVFEFMEMRRERRWEGKRDPLGRWERHGLDKGLGEVLAGTSYWNMQWSHFREPWSCFGPLVES
jgi:hypothetical protein